VYLRALTALAERDVTTVSSEHLASAAGVNSAKLRKDLSYLGTYGTRGVGYDVNYLRYQIARQIGLTQDWSVVIVGIGNLGHALANYSGFGTRGFQVAGLVDSDPSRVGEKVGDLEISPIDDLEDIIHEHHVTIGVIATPEANAQDVAAAEAAGMSPALLDRLRLGPDRLADLADNLRLLAETPPMVRDVPIRSLGDGLELIERRRPVGVIGVNYEARPNVTIDVASQLVKARNGGVLRTGSAAIGSAPGKSLTSLPVEACLASAGMSMPPGLRMEP